MKMKNTKKTNSKSRCVYHCLHANKSRTTVTLEACWHPLTPSGRVQLSCTASHILCCGALLDQSGAHSPDASSDSRCCGHTERRPQRTPPELVVDAGPSATVHCRREAQCLLFCKQHPELRLNQIFDSDSLVTACALAESKTTALPARRTRVDVPTENPARTVPPPLSPTLQTSEPKKFFQGGVQPLRSRNTTYMPPEALPLNSFPVTFCCGRACLAQGFSIRRDNLTFCKGVAKAIKKQWKGTTRYIECFTKLLDEDGKVLNHGMIQASWRPFCDTRHASRRVTTTSRRAPYGRL